MPGKIIPGIAYWNELLGSLNNEQYVPFRDVAGVIKEILKVTSDNETELNSAGGEILIQPAAGGGVKVARRIF